VSVLVLVVIVLAFGCARQEPAPPTAETADQVVVLGIDLQDGFREDTVVIRVDGDEIYNREGVSTDYALGRTDAAETQVPQGTIRVESSMPTQQLSESIVLEISEDVYVGISILDGRINYRVSDEPFTYF